jgi:Yip1 domain
MTFSERVIGALRLDPRVYEEVEADRSATGQACAVIALATIAEVIGRARLGVSFLVPVLFAAVLGWVIWALIIYVVGAYLLPEPQTNATIGAVLRTIGFAAAPGLFRILSIVPGQGPLVRMIVWIWLIMSTVVAVRQAFDYQSSGRALAVCLIGSLVGFVARLVFAVTFAGMNFFAARSLIF